MPSPKLIFFDLDGTLIEGLDYIWQHLWKHFNLEAEAAVETKKYFKHEITYVEWLQNDIALMRQAGVTKTKLLEAIGEVRLVKGAEETLRELKLRGYKIFVVSGGLDYVVEQLFPDYKNLFNGIFINRIWFDENGRVSGAKATPYDFEHKATCIHEIAAGLGVKADQTIFVGDNANDVDAAQAAGHSIAFRSKSDDLNGVVTYMARSDDLREILQWV